MAPHLLRTPHSPPLVPSFVLLMVSRCSPNSTASSPLIPPSTPAPAPCGIRGNSRPIGHDFGHCCTAGFRSGLCLLWVIRVGSIDQRRSEMCALPPKADIERHDWHVCLVPSADSCTGASTQRLERCLGDSEHDEERDRRRRDEIVRRCQVVAGHTDQPSRDEGREATEHRHRDVVAD